MGKERQPSNTDQSEWSRIPSRSGPLPPTEYDDDGFVVMTEREWTPKTLPPGPETRERERLRVATQEWCSCGGCGPKDPDCCIACKIWHAVTGLR